jgi:hypothetical protein
MKQQFSVAVRNAMLDAVFAVIGTPRLKFYSGAVPESCAAPATGDLLLQVDADWTLPTAGGVKSIASALTVNAVATGAVGYFRITDDDDMCYMQGTIGVSADRDIVVANTLIVATAPIHIDSFALTAPGA